MSALSLDPPIDHVGGLQREMLLDRARLGREVASQLIMDVRGQRFLVLASVVSASGLVCGRASPPRVAQVSSGSARMESSAPMKVVAHGQRFGRRSTSLPLLFTSRPGRRNTRERTVRTTVS